MAVSSVAEKTQADLAHLIHPYTIPATIKNLEFG